MQSKLKDKRDNKKVGISLRQMNKPRLVQKMAWVASSAIAALTVMGLSFYFVMSNLETADNTSVVSGDFRTKASGNWNSAATWEMFDGANWVSATAIPSAEKGKIEIQKGHTVKVTENINIDQVHIASGGKVECQQGISINVENGEGTDLEIKGSLFMMSECGFNQKPSSSTDLGGLMIMYSSSKQIMELEASFTISNGGIFSNNGGTLSNENGKWVVNSGATYLSAVNGDMIPTATWNQGSVCEIAGVTTTKPGNLSQTFYNLIWNCPKQNEDINLSGSLSKIDGDFTCMSSGNSSVGLAHSEDNSLKIAGNLNLFGGNLYQCTSSKNSMIQIGGNYKQTGGNFTGVKLDAAKCDGMPVMNVTGNFSISAGVFDMTQNISATQNCGIFMMNLGGNFIHTGGSITTTASKSDIASNGFGYGQINFVKSGKQVIKIKSGAISNAINFDVAGGSTLELGESILSGNGNFSLKENAGLIIGSRAGISVNGASGNVQVAGNRSFDTKANYTYKCNAAQMTGNGLPEMVNNLSMDNIRGVTLTNKVTVNGVLSLANGQVITGNNELVVTNASTSSIANYSFKNYIRGNLRRFVNPVGCYDFPIGTATNYEYMSVTLSNISGCTNLLATFINNNPVEKNAPLIGLAVNGTIIDNALNYGYWTLTPNTSTTSGTYNVSLREKGYSNGSSNSTGYCVLTRTAPGMPWQSPGKHVITTQVEGENSAIAMRAGLSTFSQFAIGTGGSAPAKSTPTITFDAKVNDTGIELSWVSNPENASNIYSIERSTDGIRFETISTRPANSNSSGLKFSDNSPQELAGYIFYRVKQSDEEGHSTYSEIKKIKYAGKANTNSGLKLVSCIPNPFSESFTASFELKTVTSIDFQLVNSEGRVVYEKRVSGIDGINRLQYIDEKGLPGGIYFLNLVCNGEKISQKILKK